MLLTRCPSCNTAFRITAELLKQASGQVRCGRCNQVFAAFAHLEEAQVAPDAHGIGSYAPPPGAADELAETNEHQALSFDPDYVGPPSENIQGPSNVQPVTADELAEIFDSDPARANKSAGDETLATENKTLLATIDPDEPLDLELPPDEWQAFCESEGMLEDVEEFGDAEEIVMEPAADADSELSDEYPEEAGPYDLESAPLFQIIADPDDGANPAEEPALQDEQEARDPQESALAAPLPREDLDAEPWALVTGEQPSRRLWWVGGSSLLAVVLLLQMGHHFRNRLAANAILGPLVRAVYGGMALDLAPDWDMGQYEIDDWIATAGPDNNGQSSLMITATLSNRGPRDQPHPYVRLELKDRWDEPVGSRIFAPAEYLPRPPAADELMAAGTKVPALLAVVDPGDDAYGFELDVCMPGTGSQLRCANQKVF